MINHSPIYLTPEDHAKLRLLVAARTAGRPIAHALEQELDRAVILDGATIPPDVVTLESRVEYQDMASGEVAAYTITLPERANVDDCRISVLAPIGTALIGCRVGDVVRWTTPGGSCELKICRVVRSSSETDVSVSLPATMPLAR